MVSDEMFHLSTVRILQNPARFVYPHVKIFAYVVDHSPESDGDIHIKLADVDYGSIERNQAIEDYVIGEFIPEVPGLTQPDLHSFIEVGGIYRYDREHGWPEIHPILYWNPAVPPAA